MALALGLSAAALPRIAHAMDIGVGLMGIVGGNFQNEPDKSAADPPYFENTGFGGVTAGGGLMIDGRILDGLLGLEVDALRTNDKGRGTVNMGSRFKATIGQGAWHVPILAKLTIPSAVVAPVFFVGPELVFPSKGQMSLDTPPYQDGFDFAEHADNYVMITVGGGVEVKLPVPILDLRIPIGLRFSYNPGLSNAFSDRTHYVAGTLTYNSEWKYAVNLTAGAALYF